MYYCFRDGTNPDILVSYIWPYGNLKYIEIFSNLLDDEFKKYCMVFLDLKSAREFIVAQGVPYICIFPDANGKFMNSKIIVKPNYLNIV